MKKYHLKKNNLSASKRNKLTILSLTFLLFSLNNFGQIIWTSSTGSAWLNGANWSSNPVIPSGTDIAQFGVDPTSSVTGVGIDMNAATNNGVNNQAIGAIEITNTRTNTFKIGNSSGSADGILTLNGGTVNSVADVVIRNNCNSLFTIDNTQNTGTRLMTLALNDATENKIYIDGPGGITINTVISGAGRSLTLNGSGSGVLQLNAANTYTGLTTIVATTLQLNNATAETLPQWNDVAIENGGTLRISNGQTLNNLTLAAGATLIIDPGARLTINGTFFHNGGTISSMGIIEYGLFAILVYGGSTPQTTTDSELSTTAFPPMSLTINNASGVTLHASRALGNTLTLTNGNLIIGNNNLMVGIITGGTPSSYVVTNGSGKLVIRNVGVAAKYFPIGATTTSFTPLSIGNGTGLDYGAKVDVGFTASAIANANIAVNRTWYVSASATPATGVNISFYYTGTASDVNPGFITTATVDHGIYLPLGFGWNINQTGLTPALSGGLYGVGTIVYSFLGTFDFPMVIGNLGAILPIKKSIDLFAENKNGKATLNWTLNTSSTIRSIEIERSYDGRNFTTLATVDNTSNSFIDDKLLAGTNFYRIKVTDLNGNLSYSITVAVLNKASGFDIVSLLPNLVRNEALLNITSAQKTTLQIAITDAMGRPVQKNAYSLTAGSNQFEINVANLAAGMYRITGITAEGLIKSIAFVKQ